MSDPSTSVCSNQATFDKSFRQAVKDYVKKEEPRTVVVMIASAIYLAIMVWAVMVALKISNSYERTKHVLFALLFPPVYLVAYYVGK